MKEIRGLRLKHGASLEMLVGELLKRKAYIYTLSKESEPFKDTLIILKVAFPLGVLTSTLDPADFPIRDLPSGDASEIFPSVGLASVGLTSV